MELDLLKRRDRTTQQEFRRQHYPWILGTCQRLLRDKHHARDCAEDIITDFLYKYVDDLEHPHAIAAYLRMMTLRRCTRLHAFQEKHQPLDTDDLPLPRNPAEEVDGSLDQERRLVRLNLCLEKLNVQVRGLLRQYYFHDQKMEDIASSFGTSRQYVGRVIGKGLATLKKCLERNP